MSKTRKRILVTGACGQLGTELTAALRLQHGRDNVVAGDVHENTDAMQAAGPYVKLDVLNKRAMNYMITRLGIGEIYHLAALLSAKGESDPPVAWQLNMQGLLNVLDAAVRYRVRKVFWLSSIAVFGPASLRAACAQRSAVDPLTIYGISKCAGEFWCRWYHEHYGLDIRSIRYPGLISYGAPAGGGTTDYAVEIFHAAVRDGQYTCFLREDTGLPMLYMPDAVRATLELMNTPAEKIHVRTSYNLAGLHFTPRELVKEIQRHIPQLWVSYRADFRQDIADSWPSSILDLDARRDWGWEPKFDLAATVWDMLAHLQPQGKEGHYAQG